MEAEELQKLLQAHELWLASDEREGRRADLSGEQLKGADLSGANLRGAIMRGAFLDDANLQNAQLIHANLSGAQLCRANLQGANLLLADFTGSDLNGADLSATTRDTEEDQLGHVRRGPRFKDADLRGADLRGAVCYMSDFSGTTLQGAKLEGANLERANFAGGDLSGLNLDGVDLSFGQLASANLAGTKLAGANLVHADFQGATLSASDVRGANLQSANLGDAKVDGIEYDRNTRFRGIRAASCYGSSRFRRFAEDQDFIEEFQQAHPFYHGVWMVLTDCGRSMLRVGLWSLVFSMGFSLAYFALGEQSFDVNADGLQWSVFTTSYYSVVTFTTLGFGDITPNTPLAAAVVMIEVVVGYVMLGILISILATKVARRS